MFSKTSSSWYVVRGKSSNSIVAEEIRIKFSENCYQTVSTLNLDDEAIDIIQNSFVTILGESNNYSYDELIKNLLKRKNKILFIDSVPEKAKKLSFFQKNENFKLISVPNAEANFSFIPTVIAGQILSLKLSLLLDERKTIFQNIIDEISEKGDCIRSSQVFLEAYNKGELNQGFSQNIIYDLKSKLEKHSNGIYREKILGELNQQLLALREQSRRTVDTVKHQAKTITVGAVRRGLNEQVNFPVQPLEFNQSNQNSLNLRNLLKDSIRVPFKLENLLSNLSNKPILIWCHLLDESLGYNLVNFLNENLKKLGLKSAFRLAQPYDFLATEINEKNKLIILSGATENQIQTSIITNQHDFNVFSFKDWSPSAKLCAAFTATTKNNEDTVKALWSLALGIAIVDRIIFDCVDRKIFDKHIVVKIRNEQCFQVQKLSEAFIRISNELENKNFFKGAEKLFLEKSNWKCLGSGPNYNVAKYAARSLIKSTGRACVADVLENHKHIDMSAESACLIFVANIHKSGYQDDAASEIEKIISHNGQPIIFTNSDEERYDNLSYVAFGKNAEAKSSVCPIIKIPKVDDKVLHALHTYVACEFILRLRDLI